MSYIYVYVRYHDNLASIIENLIEMVQEREHNDSGRHVTGVGHWKRL